MEKSDEDRERKVELEREKDRGSGGEREGRGREKRGKRAAGKKTEKCLGDKDRDISLLVIKTGR